MYVCVHVRMEKLGHDTMCNDSSILQEEPLLHIYTQFHVFNTDKAITCLHAPGNEDVILVVV